MRPGTTETRSPLPLSLLLASLEPFLLSEVNKPLASLPPTLLCFHHFLRPWDRRGEEEGGRGKGREKELLFPP